MLDFISGAIAAFFFFTLGKHYSGRFLWWVSGSLGIGRATIVCLRTRLQNAEVDGIFSDCLRHAGSRRRTNRLGSTHRVTPEYGQRR